MEYDIESHKEVLRELKPRDMYARPTWAETEYAKMRRRIRRQETAAMAVAWSAIGLLAVATAVGIAACCHVERERRENAREARVSREARICAEAVAAVGEVMAGFDPARPDHREIVERAARDVAAVDAELRRHLADCRAGVWE